MLVPGKLYKITNTIWLTNGKILQNDIVVFASKINRNKIGSWLEYKFIYKTKLITFEGGLDSVYRSLELLE